MSKFSCNGCKKRTADCHSYCWDWVVDKAFHEAERAYQNEQKAIEASLTGQTLHSIERINKKQRKGGSKFHEQ